MLKALQPVQLHERFKGSSILLCTGDLVQVLSKVLCPMSAWNSEVAIVTVNLLLIAASIQTTCSPDLEYLF